MHQSPGIRKQRTRQHIIADQSVNHVERFIIDAGHVMQRMASGYGYDLVMMTFDEQGYIEQDLLFLQLKASESLESVGENYAYDVDIRDYNLWKGERLPVILILFDATKRRAYWVHVQNYFRSLSRPPKEEAKTVRVLVPQHQVVSQRAIARMRALKQSIALRLAEGTSHA